MCPMRTKDSYVITSVRPSDCVQTNPGFSTDKVFCIRTFLHFIISIFLFCSTVREEMSPRIGSTYLQNDVMTARVNVVSFEEKIFFDALIWMCRRSTTPTEMKRLVSEKVWCQKKLEGTLVVFTTFQQKPAFSNHFSTLSPAKITMVSSNRSTSLLITVFWICHSSWFVPVMSWNVETTRRRFLQMTSTATATTTAAAAATATTSTTTASTLTASALMAMIWQQQPEWAWAAASSSSSSSSSPSSLGGDWDTLLSQLQQARVQMDAVPKLIASEKWDSVRAILITPPLSDCWAKTSRPWVKAYAELLGDRGGDELAALEAREDLVSHLRYLDMAVYNNNFNPIKAEGETGATKELIRSYYEDPLNEYKASIAALDELIGLSRDIAP